jgi:glycerol-3-phosphate O-acyltransferase/dihydroxyacetone phosphate acyltransferase
LAGSAVKLAARDVLATWKVIVALVFTPLLYGFYSTLLFGYLYTQHTLQQSLGWSVLFFLFQPFFAYLGIRLVETGLELFKSLQPLILAVFEPDAALNLRNMRSRLANDVTDFVNENGPVVLDDFNPDKFDQLEAKKKAAENWTWTGLFDTNKAEMIHNWFDDANLFNLTPPTTDEEDSE